MNQFSSNYSVRRIMAPAAGAAGATAINSDIVDLLDASSATFLVQFGTLASGAVTSARVVHGNAADLSDAVDVPLLTQALADTADDSLVVLDMSAPTRRYARVIVSRATGNATVQSVTAVIGVKTSPPAQGATTTVVSV